MSGRNAHAASRYRREVQDLRRSSSNPGSDWLTKRSGKSQQHCRNLLGKWRGQIGDEQLWSLISKAQHQGVLEPVRVATKAVKPARPSVHLRRRAPRT